MPNDDILLMVTPDGKKYNVPRSQVPAMTQKFGAKPYTQPSAVNRLITSTAGIPEGTNIDPTSKGFYAGSGDLGNYITALKQAISGLNPIPASTNAASTGLSRMKQPGIMNKVAGGTEYALSGVPYAGPMTVGAMEQGAKGDIAGSVGSSIGAGLTAAGLGASAPALAEHLTPNALSEMARKPVAGLLDVGENFEERARKEHQDAIDTINRDYEQKIQQAGEKTAEHEAAYRTKIEQAREDYARKIAANEAKKIEASTKQTGAETKKKALTTQPRSGPVYQRLSGMADQIATQDVPKLDKDVRTAQNNRWTAFRQVIGDKMVVWTPVQQAVVDAETNILQGSPENIAIFRNILREGVDPTLEKATVFRKTGGALEDVLNSKNLTEEGRARLIKQLGEEAQFEDRGGSGPAAKQNVQIPFEDARGYYTELGEKIAKARSLPGDVRRALKFVQDAADTKSIKPSIPKGQLSIYNALKSDWAQYMGDFYDSDGPLAKLKNSLNSDSRLNLITGSEGSNIIDALGRYARHNPKVVNLTGRIRSMMKQVEMLPTDAGAIPGRLEPPKLPEPPEATSLSERPKGPEPLDVTREKIEKLNKKAEEWSQLRPWQLRAKQIPLAIAERVIAELLSRPEIQRWIAG